MASTSARPKGVRPPCGEFSLSVTRCSCSDRPPAISAVASLRCPQRLPALSSWPRRPPGTARASRTTLPQSPPVRVKEFPGLRRAATVAPRQTCASPTNAPGHHAALALFGTAKWVEKNFKVGIDKQLGIVLVYGFIAFVWFILAGLRIATSVEGR